MRGALYPVTILLALAATLGIVLVTFQGDPAPAAATDQTRHEPGSTGPAGPGARIPVIRPYQTTSTLAEDLRDALAGDRTELADEVWRVSTALKARARWTLRNLVPREASPRVRALLVLAAGVHAQDEDLLLEALDDRSAIVRRAAALATGYDHGGKAKRELLGGLNVPVGRGLVPGSEQALRRRLGREKDAAVRADIEAVVSRGR